MAEALKRKIGLKLLTAYGVGVMVGAGIYVLVGAVAAQAGIWAPLSFLLAGLIAAPTALSYAEFTTRIPEAAGEAAFVGRAFDSRVLAALVGLAIVVAGTVSAGAVLRGGVGYLTAVFEMPTSAAIVVLGVFLVGVAALGVLESLSFAALLTGVELLGLALVVWAGFQAPAVASLPELTTMQFDPVIGAGIASGAVLAFFAFIGFEDIVNMAEEVDKPRHVLPRAILIALAITSIIYTLVCFAALRAVPIPALAASEKPLALVWQAANGGQARFLSIVAVFAALNGVLAQIVMASRVLYGLGRRNPVLGIFHHAHPTRGTPILATFVIGAGVIVAALFLPVATLAETTSSILLGVFVVVNLSLIIVKFRSPEAPFRVWWIVPILGLVLSAGALALNLGVIS